MRGVYYGNAVEEESYNSLFEDKKANMVLTDLPYNVKRVSPCYFV